MNGTRRGRLVEQLRRAGIRAELRELAARVRAEQTCQIIPGNRLFLSPAVLEAEEHRQLSQDVPRLVKLLWELPERWGGPETFCDLLGIGPPGRAAIAGTWGCDRVVLGRADLYRVDDQFRLLEFNVHSSTGGLENADLARAVLDVPSLAGFAAEAGLSYTDTLAGVARELARAVPANGRRPTVAVMDWWSTYPTFAGSLDRISSVLQSHGFDAFGTHVREAALAPDGRLSVAGRPVDAVYRIFLLEDLDDRPEDVTPVLEAVQNGTLDLVMGFRAELAGNKGALALLSDPANRNRFTHRERELIDRYVPWTRLARPGTTTTPSGLADLEAYVLAHRHEMVLKPIVSHGGIGVVAGWEVPPGRWADEVRAAICSPPSHVVQQRVSPTAEPMAWEADGEVVVEDVVLNWGAFVAGGRFNGAVVRGQPEQAGAVVNVAQGAALGCCLHPA